MKLVKLSGFPSARCPSCGAPLPTSQRLRELTQLLSVLLQFLIALAGLAAVLRHGIGLPPPYV